MRKPEVLAKMLPQVMSNLKKMIEGNKGRPISPKLLAIFKQPNGQNGGGNHDVILWVAMFA